MTVPYDGTPAMILSCRNQSKCQEVENRHQIPAQEETGFEQRMGRGLINGHDFSVNPYTVKSHVGTRYGRSSTKCMDHPFHQYINPAWPTRGGTQPMPPSALHSCLKDTVVFPRVM
jgi:5-hydroxyisourate hydrolase-like protein (transthyretin family)